MRKIFSTLPILLGLTMIAQTSEAADVASKVFINGRPSPVFFNDGDSFRVLAGPLLGLKARLSGFNTLESYGAVHSWGDWHPKEMFVIAKMATLNARRGIWHCTTDMKRDTYGRALMWCPDLATDQVRRGLAHAMTVTEKPAHAQLLAAQDRAIRERRGMWAHGVPEYVLTSLHSVAEGGGRDGKTYNRLVSSKDGHSAKWLHTTDYNECDTACSSERSVSAEIVEGAVEALRAEQDMADIVSTLPRSQLTQVITDYAQLGFFRGVKDESMAARITDKLSAMEKGGQLGNPEKGKGSCVLFVQFQRRYGAGRAKCLRK